MAGTLPWTQKEPGRSMWPSAVRRSCNSCSDMDGSSPGRERERDAIPSRIRNLMTARLGASLFLETDIEAPAAARVRPGTAKVRKDVGAIAAGFFEGISQDPKPVEGSL